MLARTIALGALAFLASSALATPQFGFDSNSPFKNVGDGAHVVHSVHDVHSDSRDPSKNWDRTTLFDSQKPEVKKAEPKKDFWDNIPAFPTINLRRRQAAETADVDSPSNEEESSDVESEGEDSDLDFDDLHSEESGEGVILRRRGLSTTFDFVAATDLSYKLTDWDLSEERDRAVSLSQDNDVDFDIFHFRKLRKEDGW